MSIHVFLLCYNEAPLLPHIVKHYRTYLPSCQITVYDNESTDHSVELARALGCSVVSWSSENRLDEFKQVHLRNTVWNDISSGWIIMADMDECVCVTEQQLHEEKERGVSILNIAGKDMIGESMTLDLSDIDLSSIRKYVDDPWESKHLCFLREKITEMNYGFGSHQCNPVGDIVYSSTTYINKHMSHLGLAFITHKSACRFVRAEEMRKQDMATHYTDDAEKVKEKYMHLLENCQTFDN